MFRPILALACLTVAVPAMAQNYDCQTRGYCTNALECAPDDERFTIRAQPDGTSTFGWLNAYQFTAKPTRRPGYTAWITTNEPAAIQTLTLSDNGVDATFAVIMDIGGLYHSIQALTCVPAP